MEKQYGPRKYLLYYFERNSFALSHRIFEEYLCLVFFPEKYLLFVFSEEKLE
jgi:hypothetical protein